MRITEMQASQLSKAGVTCFRIDTNSIDFENNPKISIEYDCFLTDYSLAKIDINLLKDIFAENAINGKLDVQSYRNDYIGTYKYMTFEEISTCICTPITENDGIYEQLKNYENRIEKLQLQFKDKPRTLKKRLKENNEVITSINKAISKYN